MRKHLAAITIAILASSILSAQSPAPTPLDVSAKRVHDRRTTSFFSRLTVMLELSGVLASDVSAARVVVREAVDNKGNDLIASDAAEPAFEPVRGAFGSDDSKSPAQVELNLLNPARDATTLKQIRGEIDLYMPDKDPNSVAVIPKFQSLYGKPISNKALKASDVSIAIIGPEQLEADKKKASKAKAEELKAEGTDQETIDWMIADFEEYYVTPEEGEFVLKIDDPNARINEIAFLDGSGETQRVYARTQDGMTILATYGETPEANWGLKITLRTPKTIARHTFALSDVALP